ncbi:MAG: C4-type zinc ribbon domain-containing protein [Melioribacteraceae bacterium]|nr:hypothetical protein [Melioribacteraceae bacterium]MDD3558202.1 C4-type zinc ribbon domain-containing protein [Melioribacteraceae bacterium]
MVNRLTTLYELQHIDDQLDELEELRGDLPLTVNDLNSRMSEIQNQIDNKETEKKEALEKQKENEEEIERLEKSLKKFKSQLYQVRNNKEYDALTKEIDHSEEKIEKMQSENVELENIVEKSKIDINELKPKLEELKEDLKNKEAELKKIIKANEKEEEKLKVEREKAVKNVKKSDYNTYMRIRKAKSGTAVATIVRGACSGCHNVVPPQRQIEIRASKRLYICESCGRLLVAADIADQVTS